MYNFTFSVYETFRKYIKCKPFTRFMVVLFFVLAISSVQAQNQSVPFPGMNCDGTENAIVNGSFETGDFSGWIVSDLANAYWPLSVMGSGFSTWSTFFTTAPTDGVFAAITGFDGCSGGPGSAKNGKIIPLSGIISLAQDVSVTPCTPLLMFDYRAAWDMIPYGATQNRHFRVEVQPAGGGAPLQSWTLLTAIAGTNNSDTGNQKGSVDLSAYVNQDVRIVFAWDIPECYTGPAQFQLDNVHLALPVIHATSGENGSISPEGDTLVAVGGAQRFKFAPDDGYAVKEVTVDGSNLGYLTTFLFTNVVTDHSIHVTFFPLTPQSHPPVITAFSGTPQAGNAPLSVVFSATAEDPDGGDIIQYRWDFDGDGIFDTATTEGSVSHRYVVPGDYPVTVMVVDDQWESTVSDPFLVQVSKPAVMEVPLPTVLDVSKFFGSGKAELSTVSNWVINPFGEPVTVLLSATDTTGAELGTLSQVLPAYGKQLLDFSEFSSLSYTGIKLQADHYVVLATDMTIAGSRMWAHLSTSLSSTLFVPHIAGSSDWQTLVFLSNSPRYNLDILFGGESNSMGNTYPAFIDMETLLPENGEEGKAWGKFTVNTGNPFSDDRVLSGFQVFLQDGGDGAAMELPAKAGDVLYVPATGLNTAGGWKGLALANPGTQTVSALFTFHKADGSEAGSAILEIPAGEKQTGLFTQFFPELDPEAKWARIDGDGPLAGLELLGSVSGGIAGITLNSHPDTSLTIPVVETDMITRVSVTNPGEMAADIVLSLTEADGLVKGTSQFILNPGSVSTFAIADVFPGIEFSASDYLMLKSSCGVLATVTAANQDETVWMGLMAVR